MTTALRTRLFYADDLDDLKQLAMRFWLSLGKSNPGRLAG
jgi:hypothetical protein